MVESNAIPCPGCDRLQKQLDELRSTRDGHLIAKLEAADASRLLAAGWVAP